MNRSTFLKSLVGGLLLAVFSLARADISEATFTPQGDNTYRPIPAEQVKVYVYKPNFKFKVIGIIEARGMAEQDSSLLDRLDIFGQLSKSPPTEKDDIALAMKALKEEAGANGAQAILIIKSVQVRVSSDSTERKIIAAAIRTDE
jgi:hypothetical protein